jgi:Ca-activated chloride channel homolog
MWRIEQPIFFLLFLAIAGAAFLFQKYLRWRTQARNSLLSPKRQSEIFDSESKTKKDFQLWLAILSLLVLTAIDIRVGKGLTETTSNDTVVMIALDLSTSMLAEDTRPNRCAYTKRILEQWIKQAPAQTRIGLMGFAASPQVETPPTLDHDYVLSRLALLEPEQVMEQGTDLALCVRSATKMLASQESTPLLILVTDAEDHSDDLSQALEKATEAGLASLPIGVGTSQGAPIPSGGNNTAYLKDDAGNLVRSMRNDELLSTLAKAGGTETLLLADGNQDVTNGINKVREQFAKGQKRTYRSKDYLSRYRWLLAPAIGLLFLLLWRQRN